MIREELNKYQFGARAVVTDKLKESHPERKITLLILIITFILCGVFWLKTELKNENKSFFESYSFEVIKGVQSPPAAKNKEEVVKQINELTADLSGQYAVYIYSFRQKEAYGINMEEIYPAASINKIPIMLAFYRNLETGTFKEDTEYTLVQEDIQDYGTGSMRYDEPGTTYTYRELLRLAGQKSDNTAAYVLAKLLGQKNIQKFIQALDLSRTLIEENETTAEELGQLLQMAEEEKILKTEKYKSQFFSDLQNTDFEDRLPAGLPPGTTISHKIGNGERIYHDCGLVFAKNPFVICVMSQEAAEDEAMSVIPQIAKVVWEFEER